MLIFKSHLYGLHFNIQYLTSSKRRYRLPFRVLRPRGWLQKKRNHYLGEVSRLPARQGKFIMTIVPKVLGILWKTEIQQGVQFWLLLPLAAMGLIWLMAQSIGKIKVKLQLCYLSMVAQINVFILGRDLLSNFCVFLQITVVTTAMRLLSKS